MNIIATIKAMGIIISAIMVGFSIISLGIWLILNQSNGKLVTAGHVRRYILHVPPGYNPATPVPLVISLHGYADWPAHHARVTGWNRVADANGFIVAYPMGTRIPLRWRAHALSGADGVENPDVRFIADLMDKLSRDYAIDPARIYVNGLSNGAGMTHLLSCALGDRIAAVGGVAGAFLFPLEACPSARPMPAILFHGTADEIVPYSGGASRRFDYPFPYIPDFAARWAARNGCDPIPQPLPATHEMTGIRYTNCTNNAEVVFYTVHGGGHAWPGGNALPRWIVGHTTHDISATEAMWGFYKVRSLENES